jgi:hypothetical protein
MVHVGERVDFDFILLDASGRFANANGLADYCVATIGGEVIETEPDLNGRFQFSHTFENVDSGQRVDVEAVALRQYGRRDFVKIRGRPVFGESPYDDPDQKVAGDSIRFTVYQAPIDLTMASPPDELDAETGVLSILRADGGSTTVYIDRPHRPGFSISGPEPDGFYRVHYVPAGRELNTIGTTEVDFVIHDRGGNPHRMTTRIETP